MMAQNQPTTSSYLVESCQAEDLDAHLVGPQDGELDLLVDAVLGKRQEVLQADMAFSRFHLIRTTPFQIRSS
jgi:hypothetical protein